MFAAYSAAPSIPPGGPYIDNFTRADAASLGANWVTRHGGGFKIASNTCVVAATAVAEWAAYVSHLLTDNVKVAVTVTDPASTADVVWIFLRAGTDKQCFFHLSDTGVASIQTTAGAYNTTATTQRTTAATTSWVASDVFSFEAYSSVYRVRKNGITLITWEDNGSLYTPSTTKEIAIGYQSSGTVNGFTNFDARDITTPVEFTPTRQTKNGSLGWATTSTWVDITGWLAVNDSTPYSTVLSAPGIVVQQSKTGATLAASIPFTGNTGLRNNAVRIIRVSDSAVVVTGSAVATSSGTCVASGTFDITGGEVYKVQMNSSGSAPGSVTTGTSTTFTIS